jgi:hypothetical protein
VQEDDALIERRRNSRITLRHAAGIVLCASHSFSRVCQRLSGSEAQRLRGEPWPGPFEPLSL